MSSAKKQMGTIPHRMESRSIAEHMRRHAEDGMTPRTNETRHKKTRITCIISREICIVSFSYHEFFEFPLKGAEEIE